MSSSIESLLSLPSVKSKKAKELSELIDKTEELVQALHELDYPINSTNHFVVHCVERKLDPATKEAWNISHESKDELPKYAELRSFLERRVQALEQSQPSSS